MRSTFKTVFYVNGSKEKNGIVPIMGRVTINGTIAQFSCKQRISKDLWDAKGNRAKGKSREAVTVNYALDNIKAQIMKHYQRLSDREAFSFIIKPAVEATEVSIAIRRLARRTSVLPTDKGKPTPPQAFGNKSHSSLWRFLHAPLTLMLKTPQ